MSEENLTLEEKVDEILRYQRKMYRSQIIKSVINFILFMVFIVLPIVWLFYLLKSVDLTGVTEAYNNLKGASGGIDKINEALKNLPQ